ncbi:MAG: hypothetical protein R3F20_08215 [Planctomycetota bacterium]
MTTDSNLQVSTSRHATELVENAVRDLESGELERALRFVQQAMDEYSDAAWVAEEGAFESIRAHCLGLLRGLPADSLATYRAPTVEELYRHGLADFDPELLIDVHRRCAMTSFGRPALLAAMDLQLDAGTLRAGRRPRIPGRRDLAEDVEVRRADSRSWRSPPGRWTTPACSTRPWR